MACAGSLVSEWIAQSRLWLVLDRQAAAPRTLPELTRLAVAGGVDAVLCRIKDAHDDEIAGLAHSVRNICSELGVPFIMSHHPELAVHLEADAVQIGADDPDIQAIRGIVGDKMPIGGSTHSVAEASRYFDAGAAYVFLGPVYPTPAKLKYGAPLGLNIVADAAGLPGPVVFIGGISARNVDPIVSAGGKRVAAISALQQVYDPTLAAIALKNRLPAV